VTFATMTGKLPLPADSAMAERHFERWRETLDAAGLAPPARGHALLAAIFGNSPYLSQLATRHPALVKSFLAEGADSLFDHLLTEMTTLPLDLDRATLCKRLRIAKQQGALLIALSDLCAAWPVEQVTMALSLLADSTIRSTCRWLLHRAQAEGELMLDDPRDPERGSGLLVLGMGKLGAFELNYSSDVDLIVFYDEERVRYQGRRSPQEFFVALARNLAQILDDRTADGYVFRVDLRLRPDPGSTPSALSLLAAETYYEGFGQNWERAAMIKARPVAGDPVAGARFADFIKSFIWRKHLDFAAIQDIHSIKRQIDAHRGGGEVAIKGHNVKLGRGGIREIEFFVQTQQLIWGGRQPYLRVRGTLEGLKALADAGHVTHEAAQDLSEVYRCLRSLEHRLQMVDDRQTHSLPADDKGLEAIACFMAEPDAATFAAKTESLFRRVERRYAGLFEDAPPLAGPGNLVFTGEDADPDTLATLKSMGFEGAETVIRQIRGWHHGRLRATRSARAREMLTELIPRLLEALADTSEPDAAFLRFDTLLASLPAGIQLFALFANNPSLIDLLAEILGNAPHLAETLTANPALLEDVLTGQFFDPLPPREALTEGLARQLAEADDTEEVLDVSRRWVNERKFRVGVQTLQGRLPAPAIGGHLSDLADATLEALQAEVENDFARQHGRLPGEGMAVVALGKLGGREMTVSSDLDLIMVYDLPDEDVLSGGPKPLDGMTYSARLAQRFLNALTVRTSEGTLYTTDMRLRPSGNKGPIATSLDAFDRYQAQAAWTWEHMALTRARVVTGAPRLQQAIRAVIQRTLTAERDPAKLILDVADMRDRLAAHHRANSPWDVKHRRGGLVDVEFITQYLQLRWAHDHPDILRTNLGQALEQAGALGLLTLADADTLHRAWQLWSSLQQTLRLTFERDFREKAMTARVRQLLAEAAQCGDFTELKAIMSERADQVSTLYRDLIDGPARTLRAAQAETKKNDD
jgi:glutamate-ammonia-ligase adenylyltransferase